MKLILLHTNSQLVTPSSLSNRRSISITQKLNKQFLLNISVISYSIYFLNAKKTLV